MGALSKLRLLLIMMSAVQQRVDVLQADQEAASQRHQASLDKIHELLGALVAGAGFGAQPIALPGETDAAGQWRGGGGGGGGGGGKFIQS